MGATQSVYDDIDSSDASTTGSTNEVNDDVDSSHAEIVGSANEVNDDIDTSHSVLTTPQYPVGDLIQEYEPVNTIITEPSFGPKAGGSNAAKMMDKGLLWP
jgi:hypothetical protein